MPSGKLNLKMGKNNEPDPSPKVNTVLGVFQTPTSRGVFNHRFGDMQDRKDGTGSFGASPRDISTTRAV